MRLLRLELLFCVVCCVACARPTLDEELGDDAGSPTDAGNLPSEMQQETGTDTPDAETVPPLKDAQVVGTPPARQDASMPPVTQVDAGSDAGETKPPVVAACDVPDPISSTVGSASIKSVKLNDQSQTSATVKPGAQVTVSLEVGFVCPDDGKIPLPEQFYVGFDSASRQCYATGCIPAVAVAQPVEFTFTAPQDEGVHPVLAGISTSTNSVTCGSGASAPLVVQIAAICVAK